MNIEATKVKRCPNCQSNKIRLDKRPATAGDAHWSLHRIRQVTVSAQCIRCGSSFELDMQVQVFGPPTSSTIRRCYSCGTDKEKEEFGVEVAFWPINDNLLAFEFCDFARCRRCLAVNLIRRHETLLAIEALRFGKGRFEDLQNYLLPLTDPLRQEQWTSELQEMENQSSFTEIVLEYFGIIDQPWIATGTRVIWYGKPRTYGIMPGISDPFLECGTDRPEKSGCVSNESRRDSGQRILLSRIVPNKALKKSGEWLVFALGPIASEQVKLLAQRLSLQSDESNIWGLASFLIKIETEEELEKRKLRLNRLSLESVYEKLPESVKNKILKDMEIPSNKKEDPIETGVNAVMEPLWFDIVADFTASPDYRETISDLAKKHIMSLDDR